MASVGSARKGPKVLPRAQSMVLPSQPAREDSTGFLYRPLAQAAAGIASRQLVARVDGGVAALGAAIGIIIALFGARALASLLYDVSAHDPVVIGTVAGMLLLVALVACLAPAWRAMRVDAVVALRAE